MAIATFAALKNRVLGYVQSSSQEVSEELLEDLMLAAEFRIWGVLNVPEMRSFYTFTYAAGGEDVSNFDSGNIIRATSVTVDINSTTRCALGEASEDTVREWLIEVDTNSPRVYGFLSEADGTNKFAIGPEPSGKTINVAYARKFASLTTATNLVFTTYPHIWLAALLTEVFLFLRDLELYQIWEAKLTDFIGLANELGRGQTQGKFNGPVGPHHARTSRP